MQRWFQSSPRTGKNRKSNRKSHQQRPAWRAKIDALNFVLERLEDRVLLAADVTVAMTAAPTPLVSVGGNEVYTITVTNTGSAATTGTTTVADTLPANSTFVSDGGTGTFTGPTAGVLTDVLPSGLASGSADTLTITVSPTTPGVMVNTATATDATDASTSSATATTTATGTGTVAGFPDLSITKAGAPATIGVGGTETYTLVVTAGTGTTAATGVVVDDTLPAGATSVTETGPSGVTFTSAGGVATATIATLAAGSSDTLTLTATLNAPGVAVNTASVESPALDPTPADNVATASTTVTGTATVSGAPDLSITKTGTPATIAAGSAETYTLVVTAGTGTTAATGVVVTDLLPAGATSVTETGPAGVTFTSAGGVATATIATLAVGSSATLTLTATLNAPGVAVNTANVESAAVDPTPADNVSTATTTVTGTATVSGAPDLSIVKTGTPATIAVGSAETYTLVVTAGTGTTAATGVVVADTLPAGATSVTETGPAGVTFTSAGGVATATIGTMAASTTETLTITATLNTPGVAVNTANVESAGVDATPADNVSTATTTVTGTATVSGAPDLSITKTGTPATIAVGSAETYTLVVTAGTGTAAATAVVVTDLLPSGATSVTETGPAGVTFTSAGGVATATIGSMAASTTETLTLTATLNTPGLAVNTANVESAGVDATPADNVATATTTVTGTATPTVDLSVTKTAASNPATIGTAEVYTVVVKNNSTTTTATGVTLVDTLPANGNTYVTSAGTISGNVLTDSIGSLAAGASDTITVSVTPTASGFLVNTATVEGSQVDNNQANNVATTVTPVSGTATATVDLSVTKTAATNPAIVNQNEVYTVVVTNNSATTGATGVAMADTLPANATFVSATDTTRAVTLTPTGGVLTDAIGNLALGASDTITVTVKPTATGTLVNTAAVTGDQVDNVPANNTATVTTPVITLPTQANLSITKTATPTTGTVNQNLTYTITATNASGAASAAGVTVTDTLPAGVTFVSATDTTTNTTLTDNNGTITDTIGNMAAGSTDTITVVVTPDQSVAGSSVTNSATVTTTTSNSSTNTTASVTTQIQSTTPPGASLSITKTANATGNVGQNLTYTIIVSNTGSSAATGTTMTDTLPAGLTFVSATDTTTGATLTNTGGTITDTIGSLAAGASDTIQLVATPQQSLAGLSVTNTASASSPDFNGGTAVTASATTTIAATAPTGHVCFVSGVPGDDTNQTFITNLYRELLGRDPDAPSMPFWMNYLGEHNNFAGRLQVTQAFLDSPEYKTHYVVCLYETFLGRAPDAAGLQFWADKMGEPGVPGRHGGSADEKFVLAAIVGSDEFYLKAGNTPQGWVNAVYEDLFGRAADGSGMAFWTHELTFRGAGDRDGVVRDLLTTPEAAHHLLDGFYPAAGGTASNSLSAPGTEAGTGSNDLAMVTGGGWENLYLGGPVNGYQEASDAYFDGLAAGASWDDIQLLLLTNEQFYANSNRPTTL